MVDEQLAEPVIFVGRTVTPDDLVRSGQRCHLIDPGEQLLVRGRGI